MNEVTQILDQLPGQDPTGAEKLLPLIYDELRKLAAQRLANEPSGQSLQATALVHEAFLRLVDVKHQQRWNSRGHFFGAASEAMRRILVEAARRKARIKHGGGMLKHDAADLSIAAPEFRHDLLALDEALEALATEDRDKYELVKLKFFAGLTVAEAAEALGISPATAERHWVYARAWLYRRIAGRQRPVDP
jgi:RNA polymerase sigma factor (TIGR02999 family)